MDPTERSNAFDELAAAARRVLLVAGHAWFREALAHVLNGEPDLWVVGQASTLAEVRENTPVADMADVVVIEQRPSDGAVGEIFSGLRAVNPRASVLVLAGERDAAWRVHPLGAGVDVLPIRSTTIGEIIGAVNRLTEAGVAGRR